MTASGAGMVGRQPGFWDVDERLRELSAQGDPLEKLAGTVDFEIFRAELNAALGPRDRSQGGRPPFDPVLKFRMLVLQTMHGLSLAQTEFLVADRLSWMWFCDIGPGEAVPDANTLWDFREALIAAGALDALFARLDRAITEAGYLRWRARLWTRRWWPRPASATAREEKARIKTGESAVDIWPDKPAKVRQKDIDARWTVKFTKAKKERVAGEAARVIAGLPRCAERRDRRRGSPPLLRPDPAADGKPQIDIAIPAFGYKSHISIDAGTGSSAGRRSPTRRHMTARGCARG